MDLSLHLRLLKKFIRSGQPGSRGIVGISKNLVESGRLEDRGEQSLLGMVLVVSYWEASKQQTLQLKVYFEWFSWRGILQSSIEVGLSSPYSDKEEDKNIYHLDVESCL